MDINFAPLNLLFILDVKSKYSFSWFWCHFVKNKQTLIAILFIQFRAPINVKKPHNFMLKLSDAINLFLKVSPFDKKIGFNL